MATHTIGKLNGVSQDYATPALWFADGTLFPATMTADQTGNVEWGTSTDEITVTASQSLNVTANGHNILLTAATGTSFVDNANKLTNALRYNASNGAAIRMTSGSTSLLDIQTANFTLSRLQMRKDAGSGYAAVVDMTNNALTGRSISQCIVSAGAANTRGIGIIGNVTNCLSITVNSSASGCQNHNSNGVWQDVTIINVAASPGGTGFTSPYGNPQLTNVVVAGFSTDYSGTAGTCANNATDKGTFGGTNYGTSGQVSLVATTEWQSVTSGSEDLRVNSSTSVKLKGNGTATGTPSTDIVGTTRASPPTIGAWDVGAAVGAVVPIPVPPPGPFSHP